MPSSNVSKTLGALLGVHCGDSLGATLEFQPWSRIIKQYPDGLREIVGGGSFEWAAGHATDDTDLTRAVLLAYRDYYHSYYNNNYEKEEEEEEGSKQRHNKEKLNVARLAAEYALKWNEGDWPARKKGSRPIDIGNATKIGLQNYKRLRDTAKSGVGIGNAGNGSLMRCIPTALFVVDWETRRDESIAISEFTHDDPRCTAACAAYNEIVAALVEEEEEEGNKMPQEAVERGKRIAKSLNGGIEVIKAMEKGETLDLVQVARDGPPFIASGYVLDSLTLAIAAVLDPRCFEDVLVDVVRLGSDSDTNGAIAGGLLGARDGIEKIPERWLKKLQFRREFEQVAMQILELQGHIITQNNYN